MLESHPINFTSCSLLSLGVTEFYQCKRSDTVHRENEKDNLKQVVDFVMDNYYPEISKADYVGFFRTLVNQSTVLVAKWMAVGFAHGKFFFQYFWRVNRIMKNEIVLA